jgi:hypothetical protein
LVGGGLRRHATRTFQRRHRYRIRTGRAWPTARPGGGRIQHSIDRREGRRGEAVEYFQSKIVSLPDVVVAQLRHAPFRPALEAIAHTLVYDATILADRSLGPHLTTVTVTTLLVAGGANPFMPGAAQALARALPNAQAHILEGQNHDINASVLGPVQEWFLA